MLNDGLPKFIDIASLYNFIAGSQDSVVAESKSVKAAVPLFSAVPFL